MPELHLIGVFALVVTLIVVSPGANLLLLLRSTLVFGKKIGLLNVVGITSAIFVHALLSLVGVSAIVMVSSTAFSIMKILGALYLIWLGLKSLRSVWTYESIKTHSFKRGENQQTPSDVKAFREGFFVNILNPKPALFYLSAFPQFINSSGGSILLQGFTLVVIHIVIAWMWYSVVIVAIEHARVWFKNPSVWKVIQSLSGVVFIALGVRLALLKNSPN